MLLAGGSSKTSFVADLAIASLKQKQKRVVRRFGSAMFGMEIGISFFNCCGDITNQNENQISCYLPTKIQKQNTEKTDSRFPRDKRNKEKVDLVSRES